MTPALFPELDDDRAAREAPPVASCHADDPDLGADNEEPENPDEGLDPGPDHLLQRRLPEAGFVRLVENPTPTFDLPLQSRRSIYCDRCGCSTESWVHRPSEWRAVTLRLCFRCAAKRRR